MPLLAAPTDHELMTRVRAGDTVAIEAAFDRHHTRVFSFLSRWLGDHAAAEDLMQETFLRVLRQHHTAPEHNHLLPWLIRIARNLGIDRHRHERGFTGNDEIEELRDPGPIPLERLTRAEREAQLSEALASLTPIHREILLLRTVEDLDHRAIGEMLGCTEGAARGRLHRATLALRTAWFARHGDQND